jgi:nucleotide sugar dehydrogenase
VDINLDLIESGGQKTVTWDSFKKAIKTLGENIKEDALVIIETTVPPGTCEYVVLPILRQCFDKRGFGDVHLAHSYERVMPGKNYLDSIRNFWRVYSGCSEAAADMCEEFLKTVINTDEFPLTRLSSPTASETAKVMENSYRAANIAFIEEWTAFAHNAEVDLFEIISAIRVRPTHSNIMSPGLGVGGYCLTKDPLFAKVASKEIFNNYLDFPFCEMAVKTNNDMPNSSVRLLKNLLGEVSDKRILILGVSYRQDVGDTRSSPSETFAKALKAEGAVLAYHDSYVRHWPEMNENIVAELPKPHEFDAVVFAVAHEEYKKLNLKEWLNGSDVCILDANNVLTKTQRDELKTLTNNFAGIGRGNL